MVEKVTKEEKVVVLTKKAAEKAIEILNANDFNEDDLNLRMGRKADLR